MQLCPKHPVFSSMDEKNIFAKLLYVCNAHPIPCTTHSHTKKENCQSAELSSSADPQFSLHEKE